jgi:hypothetical protein
MKWKKKIENFDVEDLDMIPVKKGEVPELPSSKRLDFWGKDAEIIQCEPEVLSPGEDHCWIQRGNVFTCINCHIKHGLFLNPSHYCVSKGSIINKSTKEIVSQGIEKTELKKKTQ